MIMNPSVSSGREIITIGNLCLTPEECLAELDRLIDGDYFGIILTEEPTQPYEIMAFFTNAYTGTTTGLRYYNNAIQSFTLDVLYLRLIKDKRYEVIRKGEQ